MSHGAESGVRRPAGWARIGWKPGSYDRMVASSRLRTFLPCEHLRRAGWDTRIVPPDGSGEYDCVVFQKAYGNDDLALAERLGARGVKTVFDLCDNHLYNPNDHPKLAERAHRLERMLETVDAVTASTPTLAELRPGPSTYVVDDALETPSAGLLTAVRRAAIRRGRRPSPREVRLVWFGNSGSLDPPFGLVHLADVVPDLERLHKATPVHLTVISNSRPLFSRFVEGSAFPVRYLTWRPNRFARQFAGHDVCLIPVQPNPFTLAKTSNRLALALMLGVPVVASRVPSYEEFSEWVLFDDWEENIAAYARDPELGRRHVIAAQEHIRRTYTPERVVRQWGDVFNALLG